MLTVSESQPSVEEQLDELEDFSVRVPYSESSVPVRPTLERAAQHEPASEAPRITAATASARPMAMAGRGNAASGVITAVQDSVGPQISSAALLSNVPFVRTTAYGRAMTEPNGIIQTAASAPTEAPAALVAPPTIARQTLYGYGPTETPASPIVPPGSAPQGKPRPPPQESTVLVRPRSSRAVVLAVSGAAVALGGVVLIVSFGGRSSSDHSRSPRVPVAAVLVDAAVRFAPVDVPVDVPVDAGETVAGAVDAAAAPDPVEIAETPAQRTIAECELGDSASAKRLLARVAAKERKFVVTTCKTAGVDLTAPAHTAPVHAPSKPTVLDTCIADPLSCQR
jgi:hypothetical protein